MVEEMNLKGKGILENIKKRKDKFEYLSNRILTINEMKEEELECIIIFLRKTEFIELIKLIGEVRMIHLSIWHDMEDPNWMEILLNVFTKRDIEDFSDYDDWDEYITSIRDNIRNINPDLYDVITVDITG